MFRQRVLSALIFVPLFLGLAWLGGIYFELFLLLVLAFAGFEYSRMLQRSGYKVSYPLMIIAISALVLLRMFLTSWVEPLAWTVILALLGGFSLWQYERGDDKAFVSLGLQVFGVFFIGVLGAYGISLNQSQPHGNLWLLVTIALVWLVDTGAYLIGTRFGKRKVAPRLSPKKTLEGLIGGTLVGLISGVLIGWILRKPLPGLGMLNGAVLGLILGPMAFFGDTLMSLIKRTVVVKDTGSLIPGHGGVLDRLDSMLWAMAIGYYFFMFFGS
jgi:phosphatidate cytidylyltransferase